VIPRPIGWISTISRSGKHNLAPYSQFNNLTYDPPYVMFSANQTHLNTRKDTAVNAEQTGKFVWNLATWDLREAVNASAEFLEAGVDEFEKAGLEKDWSQVVAGVPMVKASPVRFECEYHSTLRLPGNAPMGTVDVVIGKVVGVHIADEVITDGKLDVRKTQPIARCGYYEYAVVRETFEMVIPGQNEALLAGLEGSVTRSRKVENGTKEKEAS
jgi:flavin reductase (DIM6/NTAB) family NADH-FMN oxidoreductase RutF